MSALQSELESVLAKALPASAENGLTKAELIGRIRPRLSREYLATAVERVIDEMVTTAAGPVACVGGKYFNPGPRQPGAVTQPAQPQLLPPSLYSDVCRALRLVLPLGTPNAMSREAVLRELADCFPGCNMGTLKGYLHRAATKESEFGKSERGYFRRVAPLEGVVQVSESDILNDAVPTPPAPTVSGKRAAPPTVATASRPLPSAIERMLREELLAVCPRTEREAVPPQLLIAHLKARLPELTAETVEAHFRGLLNEQSAGLLRAANGWLYLKSSASPGKARAEGPSSTSQPRRRPGRPPGARNKPKPADVNPAVLSQLEGILARLLPSLLPTLPPAPARESGHDSSRAPSRSNAAPADAGTSGAIQSQVRKAFMDAIPRQRSNAVPYRTLLNQLREQLPSVNKNTLQVYFSRLVQERERGVVTTPDGLVFLENVASVVAQPTGSKAAGTRSSSGDQAVTRKVRALEELLDGSEDAELGLPSTLSGALLGDEMFALRVLARTGSCRSTELAERVGRPAGRMAGMMRGLRRKLHTLGLELFSSEVLPDGETMFRFLARGAR